MKVAILVDHILKRDFYLETLELLVEAFEDASVYTFCQNTRLILGPLKDRKIYSTYLSNMIVDEDDFNKKLFHLPHLAKEFKIDCSTDLVISLSRGYAHGIKIPKKAKHICYLFDLNYRPYGFVSKLLSISVKEWQEKQLESVDHFLLANEVLKDANKDLFNDSEIVYPSIRLQDYPNSDFDKDEYWVINSEGVRDKDYKVLDDLALRHGKIIFIGHDTHLQKLKKKNHSRFEFWGARCAGELGEMLGRAKVCVDLSDSIFPELAITSLAMKTPVIVSSSETNKEYISSENGQFINSLEELRKFDFGVFEFNSNLLRKNALDFNGSKMKFFFKKFVSQELV